MFRSIGVCGVAIITFASSACTPTSDTFEIIPSANIKPADSTCAQVLASPRTSSDTFYLYLRLGTQSDAAATRVFQLTALQEILTHLTIPDTVQANFAGGMDSTAFRRTNASVSTKKKRRSRKSKPEPATLGGEFDTWVSFDVARNGKIDSLSVRFPSQIPALHEMLTQAVRRADSVGAVLPVPDNLNAPQRFDLRLVVRERRDTAAEPLGTTQVRFLRFTKFAAAKPAQAPPYPENARLMGLQGDVLVSFLIDTAGAIVPGSERVLSATNMDFARVVGANLRTHRFHPAEYRGCAIPIRVQLPFEFRIGG